MVSRKNENKPERPIWPADKNPQAFATQSLAHEPDFFPFMFLFSRQISADCIRVGKSKDESFLHPLSKNVVCFITCSQNHEYAPSAAFPFKFSLWQFFALKEHWASKCCREAPVLLQLRLLLLCEANKSRAASFLNEVLSFITASFILHLDQRMLGEWFHWGSGPALTWRPLSSFVTTLSSLGRIDNCLWQLCNVEKYG